MLLKRLYISNFRCYGQESIIPFHQLTVIIGENDAGKTVILDALEILLTNARPRPSDYRNVVQGDPEETIVIKGVFGFQVIENLPDRWHPKGVNEFTLQKTFVKSGQYKYEIYGQTFIDDRFETFAGQNAESQRELLTSLNIAPGTNSTLRMQQFKQAEQEQLIPMQLGMFQVGLPQVEEFLPRFQRVSSADYEQPASLIQATLREVIDAYIHPHDPVGNDRVLRDDLNTIHGELEAALNAKMVEMIQVLRTANPHLQGIRMQPSIDFARAVSTGEIFLDSGEGFRPLETFGEGTKKKLWMGLLDWLRLIDQQMAGIPIIRVYDEPDVNLDYVAERRLFASILDVVSQPDKKTQVVVCTHALTLIDRAPAHSINLITVMPNGNRFLSNLIGTDDDEVSAFLSIMGRSVGISNSALFYERAFIVVEGESEENALPILYRHLFGRSLIEDGIVLVNLRTCGAWPSILKILQKNKALITVMLLDEDCRKPTSTALVTPKKLAEIGYPLDFEQSNCWYIGDKEFEDAFQNADIVSVLNEHYPRVDAAPWVVADIEQFRSPDKKFSEELVNGVKALCVPQKRSEVRKPDLAEKLARKCSGPDQIPNIIKLVFTRAREIAGH